MMLALLSVAANLHAQLVNDPEATAAPYKDPKVDSDLKFYRWVSFAGFHINRKLCKHKT
jgi:hypothetical protein